MALLLPLLEQLAPYIALAICALAALFAKPIVNFVHTGISWFDKSIEFLTNKAIDLAIELTKFMAPTFIQSANRLVNNFHQLGELAHYGAHFASRTAATVHSFAAWTVHDFVPRTAKAHAADAGVKSGIKARVQPFTKAQLRTLENTLDGRYARATAATIPVAVPHAWPKVNWGVKKWRAWLGIAAGAGALTLPGSTAWDRAKWKEQNRTNTQTHKRFRTLNWLLAFTGAAALVTAGLAKLGLGWMSKCKNLKHIGPAFCGADLSGLIGLFGTLAVIEGNFSIVTMAEGMLAVEERMVKLIGGAFSELDGIV